MKPLQLSGSSSNLLSFSLLIPVLLVLTLLSKEVRCEEPLPMEPLCIQVITYAKNPVTNTWFAFPTPCDAPAEWETAMSPPEAYVSLVSDWEARLTESYERGYTAGTESAAAPAGECFLTLDDDLGFTVPAIRYGETEYAFRLNKYAHPDDPVGFYWKLDPASLVTD